MLFRTLRRYRVICIAIAVATLPLFFWGNPFASASASLRRISTTNPEIAVANLESQIISAEKLVAQAPEKIEFRKQLFKLLVARTQFLGSYDDFKRLDTLTNRELLSIDDHILRIKYFTVLHRFDDAEKAIAAARLVAPELKELSRLSVPIRLARHDNLPQLQETLSAELKQNRSYSNLVLISGIESELGNFEVADGYLDEAIRTYRDSSPFPIAYLYFQRGLMWAEKADDQTRGRLYYEEALHYLPQFVVGEVHLSEIERSNGDVSAALARLRSVASANDPEARGILSELLLEEGKIEESTGLRESALRDYEKLLAAYPLAFADHGAEFFSGPGANPTRALELAKLNLSNRKSERGYIVAIRAAQAAKAQNEMCHFVSEARLITPVFVPLKKMIEEATLECS